MLASIRKLDCCGREIWRTTTAHGPQLAIDFDSLDEAIWIVLGNCRSARAWPLNMDIFLEPGVVDETRIYSDETTYRTNKPDFALVNAPPAHRAAQFDSLERTAQRPLIDGLACLPGQLDLF